MLDDAPALRAFLALVATGRMPVEDGDLLSAASAVYQIDVSTESHTPDWRVLGAADDPLGALVEMFGHPDSPRLRRAVVAAWAHEQSKLLIDCGGDAQRARDMVHLALREIRLPPGAGGSQFAADVTLLARLTTV
jgi:hypothetical protein